MNNQSFDGILNNLARSYQQKYGVAVFSIKAKKTKGSLNLSGFVLTENQKDEVLSFLKKEGINIANEKISVLSNEKERNEIGWGVIKRELADLKSRFVSNKIINEKILRRIRCSQAFQDEVVRILFKQEDQFLVQQNDLTLGWTDAKNVSVKKENLYNKWNNGNLAEKNNSLKKGIIKNDIVEEAKKFIGTKYVLGGRSANGIDCSGFVHAAYKNAADLILPKHSWDQKKVGVRIDLKDAEPGDLVFLIKKQNSHKHVGIVVIEGGEVRLIHASLNKKKVVMQSLEEVFNDYDFVEARRVVK